jgi:hypothetical protein
MTPAIVAYVRLVQLTHSTNIVTKILSYRAAQALGQQSPQTATRPDGYQQT